MCHWKTYHLHVFIPFRSLHSPINYLNNASTFSDWLCACVWASVCSIYLVFSPLKGEWKEKGAMFTSDLSTCVCRWVNRSCCHEWKTACGLLFGIEFQVLRSFDCAAEGEWAINTPSHRGLSWGVMDRINIALVYLRYLSLSLTQARSVWSAVWEAGTDYL